MSFRNGRYLRSPLQMVGFYLGWVESALVGALWAIRFLDHWTRTLLIIVLCFVAAGFAVAVVFVLIYLAVRQPHFLFNPSDYAPSVQPLLFDDRTPRLTVEPNVTKIELPPFPGEIREIPENPQDR